MTIKETENFRLLDNKEYILVKKRLIGTKWDRSFSLSDMKEIQKMINDITSFYEIKYPDQLFNEFMYADMNRSEIKKNLEIAKYLDFDQMEYRIDGIKYLLKCFYQTSFHLQKNNTTVLDQKTLVAMNQDGTINSLETEILKDSGYLDNDEDIENVFDLINRIKQEGKDINYSELEQIIKKHNNDIKLRNIVLNAIPLSILYSKNTSPDYGYVRAKHFIKEVNKKYGFDINSDYIDRIMKIDYSNIKEAKKLRKKIR